MKSEWSMKNQEAMNTDTVVIGDRWVILAEVNKVGGEGQNFTKKGRNQRVNPGEEDSISCYNTGC